MARHWILQASPDRYNIDGRLQLEPEALAWTMRQHAADVAEGDVAWIWRSRGKRGRTAGVVARGQLGAVVEGGPDSFDVGDVERSEHPVRRIVDVAPLQPGETLDRETLRADAVLRGLRILKAPQGTVFGLSDDEGDAMEVAWAARVASQPGLPEATAPELDFGTLRARRDACFRTPAFWVELDDTLRRRREALPEIRDLLGRFIEAAIDLEGFREEYDRRTRAAPWSAFGFSGMSGAMVINKLTKHAPDASAMEAVVREMVRLPADEVEATQRVTQTLAFLEALIDAGQVTRQNVQPARMHVVMSQLWHIQDPEAWPARYDSLRRRLFRCGYEQPDVLADRYVAYRRAERAARAALGAPVEVLDQVAAYAGDVDGAEAPAPAPRPRAWIIGVGHAEKDEFWRWFQADGVIAMGGAIGDLRDYPDRDGIHEALRQLPHTSDNPRNDSLGCERFVRLMQPGDRVYARQGRSRLLGMGRITGDYEHRPEARYEHIRPVAWDWVGDIELKDKPFAIHTVVELTKHADFLARLDALVAESQAGPETPPPAAATYTLDDALDGLFLDRSELEAHLARLRRRRNLVLQGPPGTGKTFLAARLARLLTGDRTDARVRRVQFHQSTTYEHFIEGFRPTAEGGFTLGDGPFKKLCDAAREDGERPHVMVIDEINRGNLSRIFGELLMLIEADKRKPEWAVELAYSGAPFWVPDNVYLVGTMNTADRSLALVDYALRRRFAFATVAPAWGRTQLRAHLDGAIGEPGVVEPLVAAMRKLNQRIHADPDLGPGFKIGHSWFCGGPDTDAEESASAWVADVVETEIAPLLEEYWFDRPDALESALALLRGDGA